MPLFQARSDKSPPTDLQLWKHVSVMFEHSGSMTRRYFSKDSEFDLIYVYGTNNLENLRSPDDTWRVRLIEGDFHSLMFQGAE